MTEPGPFQVTTAAQAQALLNFTYGARLLEQFMEPSTPSRAAHALSEPANRVTYHVRKLRDSGLLRVAGGQETRPLYQTVAQTFHVPRALVPLDEPLTLIEPVMREITHAYAHAVLEWHGRRGLHPPDGDSSSLAVHLGSARSTDPAEENRAPYAPAMRLRTVRLTPEGYRQVQATLDRLLTDLETTEDPGAKTATVVAMAFPGRLHGA